MGHNISVAISEAIATAGVLLTVASSGMPFVLASFPLVIPLAMPATTRLMLLLASDLILILVRAFRETTFTCVGQPSEKDVENAARFYRPMSAKVHKEVFKLVPKRNVIKSYRHNDVRLGLEKLIHGFKNEVTTDANPGQFVQAS